MSEDRVALLLAHLAPPRRDEVRGIQDLDALLEEHLAAGFQAWPDVVIDTEVYVKHLAGRLRDRGGELADRVIRTMPAADLYLAAGCAEGDPAALASFRDALLPTLRQALAKLGAPQATIDETIQRVLVMLFVGEGGQPQILTYGGRGTLRSWLRSIGVRTGRRLMGVEHGSGSDDDELDALPAAVKDPELELLRTRYREDVRRAFAAAFASLTDRQRNVLRQYHIDGLTIDQLAALYQVNRATTARWVAGARAAVVSATRDHLITDAGIDPSEVDSVIRLVRSQLELSVRELAVP